jgi:hypothetical protein
MVPSFSFTEHGQEHVSFNSSSSSMVPELPSKPSLMQVMVSKQPEGQATVAFSDHVRVRRTIHFESYTQEERTATWYTKEELRSIREEVNHTVKMYTSGQPIDKELYSLRGVEYWTPSLAEQRMKNKMVGRDAVLMEQEFQVYMGWNDPERLAKSYQECTYQCQISATMMGAADENAARQIYRQSYHKGSKRSIKDTARSVVDSNQFLISRREFQPISI